MNEQMYSETTSAQADEVDTSVANGFLASDDVGRNVLTGAGTALEHDVASHVKELMEQTGGRDNGTVVDDDLSCKLC